MSRTSRRRTFLALGIVAALAALPFAGTSASTAQAAPAAKAYQASAADIAKWPWLDATKSAPQRADLLLQAMNEDELVHMLHGASSLIGLRANDGGPKSIGYIPSLPQLRVPAFVMTDGPAGLRNGEAATAMPAPIAGAASFDTKAVYDYGNLIAKESKLRGQDMLFSPGFNLARNPTAGRTFEYMGEDPYLAGVLAAASVRGTQDAGIMTTIKHYVANNQEMNRTTNSSNIDQRTLHEVYEKPFQIATRLSDPSGAMCAYNKINGEYACGNKQTLVDDLRGRYGFKGIVVSDYPATHSVEDIKNGLNVELPNAVHTTKAKVDKAVAAGKITWDQIRQRVRETLLVMFQYGLFDHPWNEAGKDRVRNMAPLDAQAGRAAAQASLEAGAVLLKNNGILPLKPDTSRSKQKVLIVGEGAKTAWSGGGSSGVTALSSDNLVDEVKAQLPATTELVWKSVWDPAGIAIEAPKADVVIVVATTLSTELFDRLSLDLFPHINNAVENAASRNKNTIVVTQIPGPVLMPWKDKVAAILNVWYPGEAGGKATANLLFGKVNPSGRLPQTFPASNDQKPAVTAGQFPGSQAGTQSAYSEGVLMGYRWYDQMGQKPLFPFGYGLSYTTFEYSNAVLVRNSGAANEGVDVKVTLTNTGKVAGHVVPQAYVSKPGGNAGEVVPRKELASFAKVFLQPGQSQVVTLHIDPDQLSYYDVAANNGAGDFVVVAGSYKILVADSAADVKATLAYQVR